MYFIYKIYLIWKLQAQNCKRQYHLRINRIKSNIVNLKNQRVALKAIIKKKYQNSFDKVLKKIQMRGLYRVLFYDQLLNQQLVERSVIFVLILLRNQKSQLLATSVIIYFALIASANSVFIK